MLSKKEAEQLTLIAESDADEMTIKKAKALLLIQEGATQKAAAESTGLTIGQLTYLLRLFREKKMQYFKDKAVTDEKPAEKTVKAETKKKEKTKKKSKEKKKSVKKKKTKKEDKKKKNKKSKKDKKVKKGKKKK